MLYDKKTSSSYYPGKMIMLPTCYYVLFAPSGTLHLLYSFISENKNYSQLERLKPT